MFRRILPIVLASILLLAGVAAFAQTTSTITGTVTTAGSPLPGVTVTITSPAMQGTKTAVTGEAGGYNFPAVPPGKYTVSFELTGMSTVKKPVNVGLGQTGRADADLKVSSVAEAITVTATAPTVLETPQVSTNMTLKEVEKLPVARNQVATALLSPGVNDNTYSGAQFIISGSPGYDNLVMVNGVVVTENIRSQARPLYVEDAIQETTVMTGAISAEYGRFTGGVVNTITKSGGNTFSGSYRDNLSNSAWAAQTPALENRISKLNQIHEATLGGFVMRDRLWFFGAGRKAKTDTARTTYPIPAWTGSGVQTGASPVISYSEGADTKRYEGKLTGQINPQHSLVASYFKIQSASTNTRFITQIYDLDSLNSREDPESLTSAHYNGILTTNFLLEGQYSVRKQAFVHSGSKYTDLIKGTLMLDRNNGSARFNSPTFCGVCDTETRNNKEYLVKASYFLNTATTGTHNLVAGLDQFQEMRYANNFQSGSNFRIYVTRVQWQNGQMYPVITPTSTSGGNTYIRWTPIFVGANANDMKTQSAFVNDRWDFSNKWTFSAGFRFDKNDAVDGNGNVAAKDHRITPRLGAYFDPKGDGRHRFSLSYGQYASKIADNIGEANQSAGSPATIDYAYKGPSINTTALDTPLPQVIQQVFDYFNNTQGGTSNTSSANLRPNGAIGFPGFAAYFPKSLNSPYVNEWTLGYGAQIGNRAYAKVDLVKRDWKAAYAANVTSQTQHISTETLPNGTVFHIPTDLLEMVNSDRLTRQYRGVQTQFRWNPSRYQFGINYTYSTLKGNTEGENGTSGPGSAANPGSYYPEWLNYANYSPTGYLQADERHRARAFAGMDVPIPSILGSLNFSVLQNFDSGLSYSAVGTIDVRGYQGAPTPSAYLQGVNGSYYFSKRGEYNRPNVQSTDLAVRWAHPIARVEVYAQGDVLNILNRDTGIAVNTTVYTSTTSGKGLTAFNPFTSTPVECPATNTAAQCQAMGANFQRSTLFGTTVKSAANFQTPRTVRASFGFRF